jgi:D-arabinose 1-dehydrogenase-like Zn-dependent alcohol dehydrogenase
VATMQALRFVGYRTVGLAESGRIQPRIERFPLSEAQAAFDKLERNEVVGRAVIVPDGR